MVHLETQFRPLRAGADESAIASLRQLIMGFRTTQLVYVAATLGIADILSRGPRTPAQLAAELGAEAAALYRVLRALASLGVFAETADGSFAMTPLARALCSDASGSLRDVAVLYGDEWLWRAYGRMLHSVRTGQPAFDDVHGRTFYEHLDDDRGANAVFHQAMSAYSAQESAAIVEAYDLSRAATVVDVGGGHGALLTAILRAHEDLTGILCDLPTVVPGAERQLAEAGLSGRTTAMAVDFFRAVPSGGSVYVLKSVLHNWDDDACVAILKTCRRAMSRHARLIVAERVVPAGNAPSEAKLFDVNMLVVTGGRERTEREYGVLLERAGLCLTRIITTRSALSLMEATRSADAQGTTHSRYPAHNDNAIAPP